MTLKRVSTSRGIKYVEEKEKVAPLAEKATPKKKSKRGGDAKVQSKEDGEFTSREDKQPEES